MTHKLFALLFCFTMLGCAHQHPSYDLVITNGRIADGSGNSWFRGDIAIRDGKIVAVNNGAGKMRDNRGFHSAKRIIDAKDMIVAPGFIDVHTHIEFGLFERPTADNFLYNGVTSVITGNCGGSFDSVRDFLSRVDSERTSINVATLVGHNTVRRQVMGLNNRAATPMDQLKMDALVDTAMRDGAVGLSTGLIYLPGVYSDTAEVLSLAKVAAKHQGIYASHIRNEGSRVVEAINEALDIGRAAKMPVQISHFKVSAPVNWGRSIDTLRMIVEARQSGLDVTIDQYPYTASSTSLSVMLPDWAREGGDAAIKQRLGDAHQRKKIAAEILTTVVAAKRDGFGYAVVARHQADASFNGKSIADIARSQGRGETLADGVETVIDLLIAGGAQMIFHGMSEDDVRYFMRYPFNMVASDGGVQNGRGMPHPRSYGTNARVLAKYVRDLKIISLEGAIRRMTSLAAQKFQLKNRGWLREGYAADIVIFDESTVTDKSTFDKPHQFSTGFEYVLVNGAVTIDSRQHNGVRAGVALRGPAYAGNVVGK
ncbi:MAG: D-aminoacylase [Gammaproteobacteria bacterium]|nr:D-aminoacylase [Gammaproteobacteria bacterium]